MEKKFIKDDRERTWYEIKKWTTKAGLEAQINQCCWKVSMLPDYYCGYVLKNPDDKRKYYDSDTDVHGGVTFEGNLFEEKETWVGFDMVHYGDENITNPVEYAENECEKLAEQMANHTK